MFRRLVATTTGRHQALDARPAGRLRGSVEIEAIRRVLSSGGRVGEKVHPGAQAASRPIGLRFIFAILPVALRQSRRI